MENGKNSTVEYSEWKTSTENITLSISGGPKHALARLTWKKWLVIVILGVVFSLIVGFILGYITRRQVHTGNTPTSQQQTQYTSPYQIYDEKIFIELSRKFQTDRVKKYLIDYANSGETYHPGSETVNISAHDLSYNYCTDVGVQKLKAKTTRKSMMSRAGVESYKFTVSSQTNNSVLYEQNQNRNSLDTMRVYVAYTHSGTAKGAPVYVNYGRIEDFISTQSDYNGSVCFMRIGELNPYNAIVNGDRFGCAGVVFYPDSADFDAISNSTHIILNGKSLHGDPSTPGIPSVNEFSYSLSENEIKSRYFPPAIPVLSASQTMVRSALKNLQGTTPPVNWTGTVDGVHFAAGKSNSVIVEITTNNELSEEYSHDSICAIRGTVDADKMVIVGSHHDEAGSGRVNPATGQAIYRELLKVLANSTGTYKPRRSIVFEMPDASYLNIGHHERIEQYLKEFGDRVIAYVNLAGVLGGGSKPSAAVSPILHKLVTDNTDASIRDVNGPMYYRGYYNMLGIPIIDTVYKDKVSAVSSLPQCCDQPSNDYITPLDENSKSALDYHLKLIMKLLSEPIIPYNPQEIAEQLTTGISNIADKISGRINDGLWKSFNSSANTLSKMISLLNTKIKHVRGQTLRDVKYRRINSALIGCTRSFIVPDGVPMIDPKNFSKVLRNPNNFNSLYGSTSYNDFTSVQFPGLVELLTQGDMTAEVNDTIVRHTTEILACIGQAIDYTKRAIIDSDVFTIDVEN